jgi:hypothetical protein
MKLPVLFVGSSSEATDLADALQTNLLKDVQVVPWGQVDFELSRGTLDTLEHHLEQSDFAAFVFAPDDRSEIRGEKFSITRDNVLIELGLFMGSLGRDRVFIVLATGTEGKLRIPSDLLGLTAATYSHDAYDPKLGNAAVVVGPASTKIRNAIRRLGPRARPGARAERRISGVLERGDSSWISILADAAIYVGDNRHEYPREITRRLRSGELLPMKYLYWTPQGSAHWLDICKRQSYTFYRQSLSLIRERAQDIVDKIVQAMGTAEIDFISVGSGDGVKDNILLRALDQHLSDGALAYYYPVDISDALIVQAVPTALGSGLRRLRFRVKALIADFAQLPSLQRFYEERPAKNVFSILGNTIGNADESNIFRALSDSMLDGDLVLIEVSTSRANEQDPLLREPVNMEHDFTPLASLNVPFDPAKMGYFLVRDESIVPGTQSILAQYAVAEIGGKTVANAKLSIVHHYDLTAFQRSMEDRINVKTVARFEQDGVGLLLAQRQ